MKTTIRITAIALGLLPFSLAQAAWQLASASNTPNTMQSAPFFQTATATTPSAVKTVDTAPTKDATTPVNNPTVNFANPLKDATASMPGAAPYHITLQPGTLKANLERIMKDQPWIMIWKSRYDYPVVGSAIIAGKNFDDALNNLLSNYPVQAIFYKQNNIMTIVQRKNP